MRNFVAVIAFIFSTVALSLAVKPYDGVRVTILGTWVNENGVRLINAKGVAQGAERMLGFTCTNSLESCHAPIAQQVYMVSGSSRLYQCDEYLLNRANEPTIIVCLNEAY